MVWGQYGFLQKAMAQREIKENLRIGPFTKVWKEFSKSNMSYCSAPGLALPASLGPEK